MRLPRLLVTAAALATLAAAASPAFVVQAQTKGPAFVVDRLWPAPLPDHWVYGSITGVAVDSRDHIFVATRPDSVARGNEAGLMTTPPSGT